MNSPAQENCPICKRPTGGSAGGPAKARYAPFCSRRCSDVDLGHWLSGAYAIPVSPDEEGAAPVPQDPDENGEEGAGEAGDDACNS